MIKVNSANLSAKPRSPKGTLRGHLSSITSLEYVYIPSNVSYTSASSGNSIPLLVPTLVTSDELGWIIWWDLQTKRPLAVWKGHDSNVVTIKQLGIDWKLKGDVEQPHLQYHQFGKLLTHSKDSSIKIWDLFEILDQEALTYRFGLNFNRNLPKADAADSWTRPAFYEIPVNTLNFCNVDVCGDKLITPSTINSNNFDIYTLPTAEQKLDRIFKDVDLYKVANPLEEVNSNGRNFGIMMKVMFLDDETIAVGFESGDVVIASLSNYEVEIVSANGDTHRPNPILALSYAEKVASVVATSANDKVLFLGKDGTPVVHAIKHHGICSLSSRADGVLGMVTWDGFTRVYDGDFELLFKLNKLTPSVRANDLNFEDKNKINVKIKAVLLDLTKKQANYQDLKAEKSLKYNNGASKMIVRRREEAQFDHNWLCVGFNDGRIIFYDL